MFCVKCQADVAFCVCLDIEERLRSLAKEPAWSELPMCKVCKEHVDRCRCKPVN